MTLSVHRCRFVDYAPSSVTALAVPPLPPPSSNNNLQYLKTNNLLSPGFLAVGHANGNIDLCEWSASLSEQQSPQAWVLCKVLAGHTTTKVDSLAFTLRNVHPPSSTHFKSLGNLRLFSSGGGSELLEWDLVAGCVLRTISSQGGSIWSIAPNPSSSILALGCDDGAIRLVSLDDESLQHYRKLDRAKGRPLSIAWGPPTLRRVSSSHSDDSDDEDDDNWRDSWIVAGYSDSSLRKFDFDTGRMLERMTTDKARGQRTLVWAVGSLRDGTIISGDSMGMVKFWDPLTCTQTASFPAHGADVLCLVVAPDGASIFTAGVDQKIVQFTLISNQDGVQSAIKSRWIQACSRRMHSHDIRDLVTWPPYQPYANAPSSIITKSVSPLIVSGGLDMAVCICPCASAAASGALLNLTCGNSDVFEDAFYRRMPFGMSNSDAVQISRLSKLVLCRNDSSLSLWRINAAGNEDSLSREDKQGWTQVVDMRLKAMTNLIASSISADGNWVAVSDYYETKLFRLLLDPTNASIVPHRVKSFADSLLQHLPAQSISFGASSLLFSPDSKKLIMGLSATSSVVVIDLMADDGSVRVLRTFPQHSGKQKSAVVPEANNVGSQTEAPIVTHMTVSVDGQWLATCNSNHQIHVFNLDSIQHHCTLPSFPHAIASVAFDPVAPSTLFVGFVNNSLQVFDVESKLFPSWAQPICQSLPRKFTQLHDSIVGLCFEPQVAPSAAGGSRELYIWSRSWICRLKLDSKGSPYPSRMKRHWDGSPQPVPKPGSVVPPDSDPGDTTQLDVLTRYHNIMAVDFLGHREMIVVERPITDVLQALPPAYFKAKYGT